MFQMQILSTDMTSRCSLVLALVLAVVGAVVHAARAEPVDIESEPEQSELRAGQRYMRTYQPMNDWRGQPMQYCVTLPDEYEPGHSYPILLEWHGKGGGPTTRVFPRIYDVTGHVHVGLTYPEGNTDGGAMLYPTESYTEFMRHVYDDVTEYFAGDPDYVFIGGYSAGGFMASGPGIALMMRAGLKPSLAGVLAGGCNWMCDPRYTHGVNVLLWYAAEDSNSQDLPRRLPELHKYAQELTVVRREDGVHRCDNAVEGPAIRRFLARHGPEREAFEELSKIEAEISGDDWQSQLWRCAELAQRPSAAGTFAEEQLERIKIRLTQLCGEYRAEHSPTKARQSIRSLLARYGDVGLIREHLKHELSKTK